MKIENSYVWNRGRKRRPSEYEEITAFYSTPAVPFLESQTSHPATSPIPWHYTATKIGPPNLERSELQYEAWERFLDPDEMHYRPYVAGQWDKERHVEKAAAESAHLGLEFTPAYLDLLRGFLPPLRYSKWSRVTAFQYVIRFVPSSTVDAAVAFQAFDELRATQHVIKRTIDLDEQFGGFDGFKALWMDDPGWQPAREFAERLNVLRDWGEIIIATNLCLEPLIEALVEEFARVAAANGDMATAAMISSLMTDEARHRRWTDAFVTMLLESEQHGEANREIIGRWLGAWYPRAVAVIRGIGPKLDAAGRTSRPYSEFETDLLGRQYPGLLERLGVKDELPAPAEVVP